MGARPPRYPPNNFYCGVANANMAKRSRISERGYVLYRSGIHLARFSGFLLGFRGCYLDYGVTDEIPQIRCNFGGAP